MTNSLVSIILPVYNAELYLKECIDSLINQTYKNIEIIAIDDGSTDDSYKILQEYAQIDNRVKPYKNPKNLRLIRTLNKGIDLSSGDYIARQDADDISTLNRIQVLMNAFDQDDKLSFVSSNFDRINKSGKEFMKFRRARLTPLGIKYTCMLNTPLCHAATMGRREAFKQKFRESEEVLHVEDWDLWIRSLQDDLVLKNVPDSLYKVRTHGENVSLKYYDVQWYNAVRIAHSYAEKLLNLSIDLEIFQVAMAKCNFDTLTTRLLSNGLNLFKSLLNDKLKTFPLEAQNEIIRVINEKRLRVLFEGFKKGRVTVKLTSLLLFPKYYYKYKTVKL